MLRKIVERLVGEAVRAALEGEHDAVIIEVLQRWLNPCRRLVMAEIRSAEHYEAGSDGLASFWAWRVRVLRARCEELPGEGHDCSATKIADGVLELLQPRRS